jgi:hypothetical protein
MVLASTLLLMRASCSFLAWQKTGRTIVHLEESKEGGTPVMENPSHKKGFDPLTKTPLARTHFQPQCNEELSLNRTLGKTSHIQTITHGYAERPSPSNNSSPKQIRTRVAECLDKCAPRFIGQIKSVQRNTS